MSLRNISGILKQVRNRSRDPENLGYFAQFAEMTRLRLAHGVGPRYYLLAGFYRRDISYAHKKTHMSAERYKKWIDEKNNPFYRKISQDKLVEKAYLNCMCIPCTEYLGFLHPKIGVTADHAPLQAPGDLVRLLETVATNKIVLKKREGWGGYAVRVFKSSLVPVPCLECLKTGTVINLDDDESNEPGLLDDDGWLVEAYYEQHPVMSNFNSSSVNTLRMWVVQENSVSEPVFLGGYLRVGREGAVVDNQSSGGIVAPVNANSGEVAAAQDGTIARQEYDNHPDHGAQLRGVTIPFWAESIQLAIRALEAFPQMYFCGLDIAIGADGPVIVELNPSPDKEGAAFMGIAFPD